MYENQNFKNIFLYYILIFVTFGCQQKVQFGMKWELNSIGNEYFVLVNTTKKIEIIGGMPPHTFSIYDEELKKYSSKNKIGEIDQEGVFTASSLTGSAQVQILDSKNNRHEVVVNVAEPIQLQIDKSTIYSGEKLQLNSRGGFGKIRYQLIGFGELNQVNEYFTKSDEVGQIVIQVQDSMGYKDQKTITIIQPLQLFPKTAQILKGTKQSYRIEGGTAPFQIKIQPDNVASVSSITKVQDHYEFELSTQQSTAQLNIEVSDSTNVIQKANAQLELLNPLSANITTIQLAKGQTFSDLKVTGGFVGTSGYSVSGCDGLVQISGQYSVKAGNQVAQCQLKFSDAKSNFVTVNISITDNLTLSATNITMVKNETVDLSQAVKGGVPPFSLVTSLANSSILQSISGTQVKALNLTPGIDLVLKDSQSGTANQITVKVVVNDGLSISPSQATIAVGNSQDFSVLGGVGPYTYKVKSGSGSFDLAVPSRYLGPQQQGSAVVEVADSQGRLATANVTINQALASSNIPLVNGNPLVELVNQSQHQKYTFQIQMSGGSGGNTFVSSATSVVSVNSTGLIQAVSSGNAKVTVTDSKNNKLEIPVTVYSPLTISPITLLLAQSTENSNVTIAGGKSSSYQVSVNNNLVAASVVNTNKIKVVASATNGISLITLSDGLQQATLSVTNYGPIITNPQNLTMKAGTSTQFKISGGVPLYKVNVLNDSTNTQVATVNKTADISLSDTLTLTAKNKAGTFQFAVQDQVMSQNFNYQITADAPSNLSLAIAQTSVTSGACVQLTAGLVDQYQNPTTKVGDTNLNFAQTVISSAANSVASAGEFYSDVNCQTKITSTFIQSGQQKIQFYYKAQLAGQFGLAVQSNGYSTQTVNLTVQAALANKLAFLQLPNANSKETLATTVKVAIVDNFGNVITSGAGTLNLTKASGPATGSIANTTTAFTNGIAEINNLTFSLSGQYTLTASISGGVSLTPVTSSNIIILENLSDVTLTPGQTEESLKIVFIVDNSTTMSQSQQNLSNGIDNFLNNSQLSNLNLEFYFTTTDINTLSYSGPSLNIRSLYESNPYTTIPSDGNTYSTSNAYNLPINTNLNYYSISQKLYFRSPDFKILKTDSTNTRNTMITNIKNNITKIGSSGSNSENGVLQILRTIASLNQFSDLQSISGIKKNDKVLFVLIGDEDESFSYYPYNPQQLTMAPTTTSSSTPFAYSETSQWYLKLYSSPDRNQFKVNYQYFQVNFTYQYLSDGVTKTGNASYYYRPSAQLNYSDGTDCSLINSNLKTQFYDNDIVPNLSSRTQVTPIANSSVFTSCTFVNYVESGTYNWIINDLNLTCNDFTSGLKTQFGGTPVAKDSLSFNVALITSCSFISVLPGTSYPGLDAPTGMVRKYSYYFMENWLAKYPNLDLYSSNTNTAGSAKLNYMQIAKDELKKYLGNGFYFAFIINPTSNDCTLQSGQSVGYYHQQLSQLLGTQSSVIPICQPSSFSTALSNAGLVMKTYMTGSFTLTASVVNEIKYVDILRNGSAIRLTKDVEYTVTGKNVQIISDVLQANDQVKIYWR